MGIRYHALVESERCSRDGGAEKSVGKTGKLITRIEQGWSARRAEEEHAKTSRPKRGRLYMS